MTNSTERPLISATDLCSYNEAPFAYWCRLYADPSLRDKPDPRYVELMTRATKLLREHRKDVLADTLADGVMSVGEAEIQEAGVLFEDEVLAPSPTGTVPLIESDTSKTKSAQFHDILQFMNTIETSTAFRHFPLFWIPESMMGVPDLITYNDNLCGNTQKKWRICEIKSHKTMKPHMLSRILESDVLPPIVITNDQIAHECSEDIRRRQNYTELMQKLLGEMRSMTKDSPPTAVYMKNGHMWKTYNNSTAIKQQDVSLIQGISAQRRRVLNTVGLYTVEDVASCTDSVVPSLPGIGVKTLQKCRMHAVALASGKHHVITKPVEHPPVLKNDEIVLMLDIETLFDGSPYMIGVMEYGIDSQEYKSFHGADCLSKFAAEYGMTYMDEPQKGGILGRFKRRKKVTGVIHWGNHDNTYCKQCGLDTSLFYDLYKHVTRSYILPIHETSIKAVSAWLGYSYDNDYVDYSLCERMYGAYAVSGDGEMLEKVTRYNRDDCAALRTVYEWILKVEA